MPDAGIPAGDMDAWLAERRWRRVYSYKDYEVTPSMMAASLRGEAKKHGLYVSTRLHNPRSYKLKDMNAAHIDFIFYDVPADLAS